MWSKRFMLGLVSILMGCQANLNLTPPPQSSFSGTGGGNASSKGIDRFKTSRPPLICGKAGWTYLKSEFFQPQCAACHSGSFPAPYRFGSSDPETSYQEALRIPAEALLRTARSNQFLLETSHLSPDGEVYQGIVEWTRNSSACPTP